MPDDYYTQADDGTPPDDEASPDESKSEDSNTTLVPASFFGDKELEVGSKCEVEIVHVFNDEVELRYKGHDEEKSESPNMDESEKSFDAMVTEEA